MIQGVLQKMVIHDRYEMNSGQCTGLNQQQEQTRGRYEKVTGSWDYPITGL